MAIDERIDVYRGGGKIQVRVQREYVIGERTVRWDVEIISR